MSVVLKFHLEMETHECPNCGMPFGVSPRFIELRRQDKSTFFCPKGHTMSFHESPLDRIKKELEAEKKRREWAESQSERARKSEQKQYRRVTAMKGVAGRLRKRVANGVCPCCNRSFSNLSRHIETKHSTWKKRAIKK